MTLDMTTGSPIKKILRFFFPVFLGNLLQQFYSMADSAIVSRFINVNAFAGVSATGALTFLIFGFTSGMCAGFSIPIAQEFGAGNRAKMRSCFSNAMYTGLVLSVVLAVVTTVFTPQILRLIGTPDDIFDYSCSYIRIIFMGIPTSIMYNMLAGAMRAVGDGKTPLIMLIVSSVLNILMDLMFILVFDMGVAGAALATVIAQFISGILCLYVVFVRTDILKVRGGEWQLDFSLIRRMVGVGLPMGLQFSITAIGSTILQRAVNSLGSVYVAAIGAGGKAHFMFSTAFEAIGATMATYTGQNLGAKRIDRVRRGVRDITFVMLAYWAVAFCLQMLLGKYIVMIFTGASEATILGNAVHYLNVVMSGTFLLAFVHIYRNSVQGLGYSSAAMFAGIMELVGRAFVALVLVKHYGFNGACYANIAAWLCADMLLVPLYFVVAKRQERKLSKT